MNIGFKEFIVGIVVAKNSSGMECGKNRKTYHARMLFPTEFCNTFFGREKVLGGGVSKGYDKSWLYNIELLSQERGTGCGFFDGGGAVTWGAMFENVKVLQHDKMD